MHFFLGYNFYCDPMVIAIVQHLHNNYTFDQLYPRISSNLGKHNFCPKTGDAKPCNSEN